MTFFKIRPMNHYYYQIKVLGCPFNRENTLRPWFVYLRCCTKHSFINTMFYIVPIFPNVRKCLCVYASRPVQTSSSSSKKKCVCCLSIWYHMPGIYTCALLFPTETFTHKHNSSYAPILNHTDTHTHTNIPHKCCSIATTVQPLACTGALKYSTATERSTDAKTLGWMDQRIHPQNLVWRVLFARTGAFPFVHNGQTGRYLSVHYRYRVVEHLNFISAGIKSAGGTSVRYIVFCVCYFSENLKHPKLNDSGLVPVLQFFFFHFTRTLAINEVNCYNYADMEACCLNNIRK